MTGKRDETAFSSLFAWLLAWLLVCGFYFVLSVADAAAGIQEAKKKGRMAAWTSTSSQ